MEMGPKEKLWFYILYEIKKIPKKDLIIPPNFSINSNEKQLKLGEVHKQMNMMMNRVCEDTGRSKNEVDVAACMMANKGLLHVSMRGSLWTLPYDGNLVTVDGDEFMYNIKHNNDNNGINIANLNTKNANIGSNNSNIINQNVNVNSIINKLKDCENKMDNEQDEKTLNELCESLKGLENSKKYPRNKLSNFKGFVKRNWKIIGPIISPIIVKIGLAYLGL